MSAVCMDYSEMRLFEVLNRSGLIWVGEEASRASWVAFAAPPYIRKSAYTVFREASETSSSPTLGENATASKLT